MEHFILPLIIIIFLMLPISVRAVRSKQAIDVDIYLSKLLDIKIDYNTFMRGLLSAGREQVKSSGLFQTIQKTYEYRSLLNDITKRSNVTKVTFVPKYYIDDPIVGTYINILNWNVISIFKKYLHTTFVKLRMNIIMLTFQWKSSWFLIWNGNCSKSHLPHY